MPQSIFSFFPRLPDNKSAKRIQFKSTYTLAHTAQYCSNQFGKSEVNAFRLKFFSKI